MNPFAYSVASIISEICERVGMPPESFDVGMIEGSLDGLSGTGSTDAYSIIEEISKIIQFDSSSFDGAVHFVPRGLDSVATISEDDLIAKGEKTLKVKRRDSINTPRVLNLNYYDISGGTNTDKQQSDRSLDTRAKNESSSTTTVIMDADTAKTAVVIAHKLSIEEQRGEYEFELPMEWVWLTVGDCVIINGDRLRITEVRIDEDSQKYKATFDRQSAYKTTIKGIPAAVGDPPPNLAPADTLIDFIDCPIIQSSDDELGFYMAVTGATQDWRGAIVSMSRDGGENYTERRSVQLDSIIGTSTTAISDHPASYPDYTNTLTVELARDDMELITASLAETMNRANLAIIGDELIAFMNATQIADSTWELSGLLRGRKGTETTAHEIGERFVLMKASRIIFVPVDRFDLNRDLTFRAVSFGGTNETIMTRNFTGQSQVERQPAYLTYENNGGTLTVNWQGVGRLGGGVNIGMGQYFRGYQVSLDGVTVDTLNTTAEIPYASGTLKVQQRNEITGLGEAAEVVV